MMQQCWKGSVAAVDEASNREDSNTSNHVPWDPFSTVPNADRGHGHATIVQTLLLRVIIALNGVHSCSLFVAAVVYFHMVVNSHGDSLSWSILFRWDFNITTSKVQALEKTAWERGRRICGIACLPPTATRLTATTSRKQGPELALLPQPPKVWLKFTIRIIGLNWWKFVGCIGCDRNRH